MIITNHSVMLDGDDGEALAIHDNGDGTALVVVDGLADGLAPVTAEQLRLLACDLAFIAGRIAQNSSADASSIKEGS